MSTTSVAGPYRHLILGQLFAGPGIKDPDATCPWTRIHQCVRQHASCEWGHVTPEQHAANELALRTGGRIRSCYPIDPRRPATGNNRLWIITEPDRSSTTCMLATDC